MTQARWSAGSSRNHGRVSSMRATLAVARAPAARSIARTLAASGTASVISGAFHVPP